MILQMINHILWQIDISSLPAGEDRIKVKTQRMKSKDRYLGVLNMPDATEVSFSPELQKWFSMVKVDVAKRLKLNKRRKRLPIIYHKITANKTYSTINLQMRVTELEMAIYGTLISGGQPAEQAGGDGQVWQHDAGGRLRLHPGATISKKRSQYKMF